ncbi:hypothetical protein D3C72_441670 [compost metagenome]
MKPYPFLDEQRFALRGHRNENEHEQHDRRGGQQQQRRDEEVDRPLHGALDQRQVRRHDGVDHQIIELLGFGINERQLIEVWNQQHLNLPSSCSADQG